MIHPAIIRFDIAVQNRVEIKDRPAEQREPFETEYLLAKAHLIEAIERAKHMRKDR